MRSRKLAGDNEFTRKCTRWLSERYRSKALLTTSGTHALELAALLADLKPGDEVILPSFTFSSTATAFALRQAKLVFVDIRPDTMNIDEKLVEAAITPKTRVVVAMHYAGVCCEMQTYEITEKNSLFLVEDAAHAILSRYQNSPAGSLGDAGCFSFHETKNFTCGEGGALILKSQDLHARAEVMREKGTNRSQFFRGDIDKYTWLDMGSSYLPSELNAALLWSQFEVADWITRDRLRIWKFYREALKDLELREPRRIPNGA
ncbi:MAG: dTDP-4-amino-4,6-dideoxygalactose transaminase [Bdellovibrionota bacterium]